MMEAAMWKDGVFHVFFDHNRRSKFKTVEIQDDEHTAAVCAAYRAQMAGGNR